jgi:hypothetical protein
MTAPVALLPAELLDLLVDVTITAVVAELRANPHRDSTDPADVASDDADFGGEGLGRPA